MTGQQINLYQERFRPKMIVASFNHLLVMVLLLVVGTGLGSYWLSLQLDQSRVQLDQLRQEQARLSSAVINLNAEIDALVRNSGLDSQIELTAIELAAHKRVLGYIENDQQNYGQGFSAFLSAIARVSVPGVWLHTIQYSHDLVYLRGSSLNEEAVPGYFDRFSAEEVLAGRQFDVFEVKRTEDWKVDFEIATQAKDQ